MWKVLLLAALAAGYGSKHAKALDFIVFTAHVTDNRGMAILFSVLHNTTHRGGGFSTSNGMVRQIVPKDQLGEVVFFLNRSMPSDYEALMTSGKILIRPTSDQALKKILIRYEQAVNSAGKNKG